uniref:G-protein coupled receptors family 1 profile domain-containing protein n=1 Tax=Poecilia reticulata TaxID=8081 RepID=A0A3P9PZG5_POERE
MASYILAYSFIFLLCMVGNVLVCLIVLENRCMRTVTNLFILNLAVSDLLVGIFCIPTTLVDNLITGKKRHCYFFSSHYFFCCVHMFYDICCKCTTILS